MTHRLLTLVFRTASLALALPTSRLDSPGSCVTWMSSMLSGFPHVRVNEQDSLARLRQSDREIRSDDGLSLPRLCAGNQDRTGALFG